MENKILNKCYLLRLKNLSDLNKYTAIKGLGALDANFYGILIGRKNCLTVCTEADTHAYMCVYVVPICNLFFHSSKNIRRCKNVHQNTQQMKEVSLTSSVLQMAKVKPFLMGYQFVIKTTPKNVL